LAKSWTHNLFLLEVSTLIRGVERLKTMNQCELYDWGLQYGAPDDDAASDSEAKGRLRQEVVTSVIETAALVARQAAEEAVAVVTSAIAHCAQQAVAVAAEQARVESDRLAKKNACAGRVGSSNARRSTKRADAANTRKIEGEWIAERTTEAKECRKRLELQSQLQQQMGKKKDTLALQEMDCAMALQEHSAAPAVSQAARRREIEARVREAQQVQAASTTTADVQAPATTVGAGDAPGEKVRQRTYSARSIH
jgi:hypothetical protein